MAPLPSCPGFSACGGCKYDDLAYDRQLAEKQKRLEKLLRLATGYAPCGTSCRWACSRDCRRESDPDGEGLS